MTISDPDLALGATHREVCAPGHTESRRPRATAAPHDVEPKRRRSSSQIYYALLVLATIAGIAVTAYDPSPTFLAAAVVWSVVTLVARPSRNESGRGFFVVVTTALTMRNYAELPLDARLWAFLTMALLLSVFALLPLTRAHTFPFLHLWCLVETLYVYVAVFIARPDSAFADIFTEEVRTTGFRLLALFSGLLVATGLAMSRIFGSMRVTMPSLPPLHRSAIVRAYVLIIFGSGVLAIMWKTESFVRFGSMVYGFKLVAFGGGLLLALLWLQGRLPIVHKVALVVMAGLMALSGLGDGALYTSALPGFLVLALVVSYRRTVPWTGLLLGLLLMIVLNVGKGQFRQDTWNGKSADSSTALGIDYLQRSQDNLNTVSVDTLAQSAHRFSNSDVLGYVGVWVPDRYPYFGHVVYTEAPMVLIPRVIMPDKPPYDFQNEFGRRYELIGRSDYATAMNTPLPAEAMVAGGYQTLILVAMASGLYLALLGWLLRSRSPAAMITGALLTYTVVNLSIESGMQGFLLAIPFAIFLYPIMAWACHLAREHPRARGFADAESNR